MDSGKGVQTAMFDCSSDWDREIKRSGATEWRVCAINEEYLVSPRCVRLRACACMRLCLCVCMPLSVCASPVYLCLCVSVHIQHVLNISFQRAVWIIREIRIRKIRVSLAHYVQKSSFNESNIVLCSRLSKSGSTSLYNGSVTHDNIYCCY